MSAGEFLDQLLDRPRSHVIGGFAVLLLFSLYLWWTFYHGDIEEQYTKLQQEVEKLQVKKVQEQRIARNLGKYEEEVRVYDTKLDLLLLELPDRKQIPSFLSSIETLAHETGLEVIKFSPTPEQYEGFYARVPVNIETRGTFHKLATFFDEVAHLNRIVNIDDIDLTTVKEDKDKIIIGAQFRTTTFRFLDEEEQKKYGEKKEDEKGKKGKSKKR